jgi:hypothetical protein
MAAGIPPPPLNSPSGSYYWLEWYTSLTNFLNGTNIPWSNINFAGSNIADIQTRNHNDLQNIQGGLTVGVSPGNAFHLVGAQYVGAVSAAGTLAGPPSIVTWTCSVAGGVFTVNHNLGLTPTLYSVSVAQQAAATLTSVVLNTNSFVVTYSSAVPFAFSLNQGS